MDKKEHLASLISFLQQKGFVWGPEPEIYGGTAGFYTYAPLGKLLKNKIENTIRRKLEKESFFEVECPIVSPEIVWQASGHTKNLNDLIVKDAKGNAHRADHLINEWAKNNNKIIKLDGLSKEQVLEVIKNNKITAPGNAEIVPEIKAHNLMIPVIVGVDTKAYVRGETATATYMPFLRYTDFFRKSAVFGVFQIGKAFRNEISPRQHIIRMREFTQAEAQLFIKKELKNKFDRYNAVENDILPLWDYESQEKEGPVKKITLKEAIQQGHLKNQAYAWGVNLAYKLFKNLGIPEDRIRMRQHFPDERAFYCEDAWDVEINTNCFGWIEACGVHDRTDYDLKQHAAKSGMPLEAYDEETKEKYVPHIIEIAFGSDRPVFTVLDNFYEVKEKDEGKTTLKIPYHLSPAPVAVFPLMKKPELTSIAKKIQEDISKEFTCMYDESGQIGRRYLRAAESGTAFCITVDYESLEGEQTVTLRDRDSEKQKRVATKDLRDLIRKLISGDIAFDNI